MGRHGGTHDGILKDDEFRGRMKATADRNRRLSTDYRRRAEVRRGGGQAAPAGSRSEYRRRVVVKAKYHDRTRNGRSNMVAALLNYLEKEGEMHGRDGEAVEKEPLRREWEHDRRIFHVIVSPNDGHRFGEAELVGPGSVGTQILERWERRVGPLEAVMSVETKPDAAHPEGNRHIHIAIRGVQEGKDLFLRKEVLTERFREDAEAVVTDRLGYMSERERQALERQLERHARERAIERGIGEREREPARDLSRGNRGRDADHGRSADDGMF